MTKIDKKQFYVIVGLAGIIATAAAFTFPLQTAESLDVTCPSGFLSLPDGTCVNAIFCTTPGTVGHCLSVGGLPPGPVCVLEHWDKIIFKSKKDVINSAGVVVADKKSIMDIKVIDDPTKVEFPMQKAADKLNSVGWTTVNGVPFTPSDLKLIDIEYALICIP